MSTTVHGPNLASRSDQPQEGEQALVLHGVGWDQYEAVLKAFPEQAGLRITYVDRRLSLVSPSSRRHDWYEKMMGRIVEAVAEGLGLALEPGGHATYRRADLEAGVEGDQSFYFGDHSVMMRGPVDVDLSTQPPPDLTIEVEVTHRSDDSVEVWRRLGVPEVWRLDVERGTLAFLLRQPDGPYLPAERSLGLTPLEPSDVLSQLEMARRIGYSHWTRGLADWVRDTLSPRLRG